MITSPFLGELIGTMVLILLGNGVVANVLLSKTKGNNGGLIAITAGWGFAVTMGIFIAQKFGSPGAHLNPAVTIAMAVKDNNFSNVLPFISAQLLGAILGATLVWLHHLPHWGATNDQGAKLAAFSTSPAIPNAPANLISEIIGTLVLLIGVIALYAEAGSGMAPLLVGVLVWAIGLSLGGTTGYAINPARDLGPRIAHTILPIAGKGGSDWGYAWVPVVGPIVAALIAGGILNGFGF
ncbi:MIP/aquaporin family protein [Haliscomenobacter hydrossis]|uniref:Major intrinsic protein n=1 Tax=Haliscomenobacter hydrossis (strain ATCC 27775 / DSM 1100 / LMG 10767 / O) TaxID=760192 RepID=F4KTC3_HALH1|nr:MIP/aquaporin family protein [Haliscomenobacter hydrossis]AEE51180.1 major intrinsic protein [Haliscomenobacter hydrossis DSM 1100]